MRVPDMDGNYHELSPEAVARIEESRRKWPDEIIDREMEEALDNPALRIPAEVVLAELDAMFRRPDAGRESGR